MWERMFSTLEQTSPDTRTTFIHRDYHHWNTLWRGDELTGLIDWTTGCVGPPGIDLARERLNLVWDVGIDAADAFLRAAQATGVSGHHPYWDLLDAADWLSNVTGDDEAARYESYETFVRRALAEVRG
jgi:aminoglycoside phosphotransferase (APT) family kinase protein